MNHVLKKTSYGYDPKHEQSLFICYELGKQAAWDDETIDSCPHYQKQSKVAAWLKGYADAELEKQNMELLS